jgi:hypothetical protein
MAMAGNIVDYRNHANELNDPAWKYDFGKVSIAATTIYTYITLIPLLLWGILRYTTKTSPSLLDIVTVYGYSLFVYIPVSVVCIFPWVGAEIDWVAIVAAMLTSGGVLVINFYSVVRNSKQLWLLGAIACCHIGLTIVLKLYFFKHTAAKLTPHHTTTTGPLAMPLALDEDVANAVGAVGGAVTAATHQVVTAAMGAAAAAIAGGGSAVLGADAISGLTCDKYEAVFMAGDTYTFPSFCLRTMRERLQWGLCLRSDIALSL